jgi:phosphoenolpyruvate-protein kinase (PTS system EI component)
MNPSAIPDVKQTISRISMAEAEKTAEYVLNLDSAEEVRKYVLGRHFR